MADDEMETHQIEVPGGTITTGKTGRPATPQEASEGSGDDSPSSEPDKKS